tara:strand:- start:487 stop:1308 length:822 start_codon:yes stop_codon:yes gene_type:complete
VNLNKIIYAYDRDGLIASINSILSKIGIKFRIKNQIEHRQNFLLKTIANKSDIKVLQGPFKGMKLTKDFKWDKASATSKILGVYENSVLHEIIKLQKKYKKKHFVNFGAAEGYFIVGLMNLKLFSKSHAYEIDNASIDILKKNILLNKLNKKNIEIVNANCKKYFQKNNTSNNCIFLIDIEGDEFGLLTKENLRKIKKSILIIEFHEERKNKNINIKFVNLLKKFYKIKFIYTDFSSLNNLDLIKNFNDIDRFLLINENRNHVTRWIVCEPLR